MQSRSGSAPYRDEVVYTARDGYGNPIELKGKDGAPVTIVWSYRNRFPIAKIENASNAEVYGALGVSGLDELAYASKPEQGDMERLNGLRSLLPDARVTTYLYDPALGVVESVDPNGVVSRFAYDGYGRLTESGYLDPEGRKTALRKYVYRFGTGHE